MKTKLVTVNYENPQSDIELINEAAYILQQGGLVAFPTETVYGLGANALDPIAVKKIYTAKGRPSDNPLIAHISDISELKPLVRSIPDKAQSLIDAYWPGPLTIIFEKSDIIPQETSGGLNTVAIRYPENKIAQLLIRQAGFPIAAPSANSSGKPSPTRASHVEYDLKGRIDMIIDGGHCEFGLESTIIDMSGDVPCLLRPGSITIHMLEEVLGHIEVDKAVTAMLNSGEKPKAPGMKYTHYSPTANVTIVKGEINNIVDTINRLAAQSLAKGISTGVIATEQTRNQYKDAEILVIGDRLHPETIASNLFKMLRKCDYLGISQVYVEAFPEDELGLAIMNRLKKAAGYNIIEI